MSDKITLRTVGNAAKWSSIAEISVKFITPITNMILARLLAPEAFGVIASVSMVISFADMFTDAGFQKYLVQHEFLSEDDKHENVNVAFWTNLVISFCLWFFIILFRESIAKRVGNAGLGNVLAIACVQLPLTSFSSIQMALYRRDFDFKSLFYVKIIVALLPLVISVPLALIGLGYWSLIIGSTCRVLANAVLLTIRSSWKPKLYYDFELLKRMFSFSIWSLIEAISIWLTNWVDILIIGSGLNEYYLGLYKTSLSMVNSLLAIITASVKPVLFSALSRLQNDNEKFTAMFFNVQRIVAYLAFPLGVGIFLYRDLAVKVMLGEKWAEAGSVIGIWALTSTLVVVSNLNSEVYRSKGRPKVSFISQLIHLFFLVPTCIVSLKYGFKPLVYARALIRLQAVFTGLIMMQTFMQIKAVNMLKNISKPVFCTVIMTILALGLKSISASIWWSFFSIIICIIAYGILLIVFAKSDIMRLTNLFTHNKRIM